MGAEPALEARGLCKSFNSLKVMTDVDLCLPVGGRHALIGPNGAGKSTLINLLSGALRPSSGRVFISGSDVTALPAHVRVARGVSRTFQVNTLFPDLTPLEAVTMAVCQRRRIGASLFRRLRKCSEAIDEAYEILARLHLASDATRRTRELAYGRQRLLEIALALASNPAILLLDEPAAGVPEIEAGEILSAVEGLPANVAVMFIEHDIDLVFRFAQRITVLFAGRILSEGTPVEIARDAEVRRVYLGEN